MKTYEAIFDEEHNTGVYGISLVQNPAMQGNFIALSKDEKLVKFKDANKEEKKVVGLVLEPNKPIYRNQGGEEYNIVFSENTIKNLSYNFFKQNFQKNSTIEHEDANKIEGVTFVESWIVEDVKLDKQNIYGFSYPKGSWLAVLKIDNDDVWNGYVKTGEVKGFSIDGLLSLKEVNLKSNINMSKEVLEETQKQTSILSDVLNAVKLAFTPKEKDVKEEVKLGSVKTQDGKIVIEFEGDELVVGASAWIMADEVTKVPVPVGEHTLEDGKVLVVTEEGIVGEIKDAVTEEAPAEPQAEEMAKDTVSAPSETEQANEIANAIKSILVKYEEVQADVKEIKTSLAKALKENEELKVALNEQPATKPKKSQPTQVNFSKLTTEQRINAILNKK